ncbi:MAG: hypothetical protein PHD32_10245 [Eubacteriales bacterium]|nr:hypothetical protein [Eubacteriales bacterium]
MKKIASVILVLLLLFSAGGCAKSGIVPPPAASAAPAAPSSSASPAPSATPQAFAATQLAPGVSRLNMELHLADCQSILVKGSFMILGGGTTRGQDDLHVVDLVTGKEVLRKSIGAGVLFDLDGDSFGYLAQDGKVYRFDRPTAEATLLTSDNQDYNYGFLRSGGLYKTTASWLSFWNREGAQTLVFDYTGKYDYASVNYEYDGAIYVTAGKSEGTDHAVKIDLQTGEQTDLGECTLGFDCQASANTLWSKIGDQPEIYRADKGSPANLGTAAITAAKSGEALLCANDDYVVTCFYDTRQNIVAIYGKNGDLYYYDMPPENTVVMTHCVTDTGLYLCCQEEASGILQWYEFRFSQLSAVPRPTAEPAPYADGITVLSEQAAILDFNQFTALPLTDESLVQQAQAITRETLDQFPAGFFDELLLGDRCAVRALVICLTDRITPTSGESINAPGGYAYTDGMAHYIVLDASHPDTLKAALCHELMHTIDRYLQSAVGEEVYPDWNAYIPTESAYYNSYRAQDGSEINDFTYTENGYTDKNQVWFPTPYCRTYAIEDRAVLFDLMFTHNPYYKKFPHIKARMNYLAQVLRQNFVSIQNADSVIWE